MFHHFRLISLLVLFFLAACNNITPDDTTPKPAATDVSLLTTDTPTAPSPTQTPTDLPTASPTIIPCVPPAGWQSYTVQTGDTFYGIASEAGTTVVEIMEANCLETMTFLEVGQTLFVPPPPTPTVTASPSPTAEPSETPTPKPAATETADQPQDPRFIAYTQLTENGPQVFVVATGVEPPRTFNLTGDNAGIAYRPRWSPDAAYIAYFGYDPNTDTTTLWMIDNANDAASRPLSEVALLNVNDFDWSADSHYIVYSDVGEGGGERDVYRLEVTTGEVVNLTADAPTWDSDPTWSPDGEWIAFVSDRAEGGKLSDNIWLMRPDGSEARNLTDVGETYWENIAPAWSPDGSEIAFLRWGLLATDTTRGPAGLWVINLDGEERLLVEGEGFLAGAEPPVWSPDGRWLAYQSGVGEELDVYVVSAEGGEPVQISDLAGQEHSISWSANSQQLIFTYSGEETFTLYLAAADGSRVEPLFDEDGNGYAEWAPPLLARPE